MRIQENALEAKIERGAVEGVSCGGSGLWRGWAMEGVGYGGGDLWREWAVEGVG